MKSPQTLLFMLRNPIPLIVHLTWWLLFAAWGVIADDPFIEGTWPHIVKIVTPPASVGNFITAASIVFNEVVEDIVRHGHWILVVIPPFLICYREATGNRKGIAKEHQVWMKKYRQQQGAIAEGAAFEESSLPSKKKRGNSYFRKAQKTLLLLSRNPKLLLIHFLCWIPTYFSLILITEFPGLADIVRTASKFTSNFFSVVSFLAIVAAIFGLISSYQETRGAVKGTAKVQQAWTEWYHQREAAKVQETPFDVPPPSFDTF